MKDETVPSDEIELELMAYVDGLLEGDPARKRAIERRIADDVALAELVRTLRAQNDALRDAYADALLDTPIPERLSRVLDTPERSSATPVAKLSGVAAAIMIAAIGGWYAGHNGVDQEGTIAEQFLKQSHQRFIETTDRANVGNTLGKSTDVPVNWLSNRLSLRLQAPDLRAEGYSIVDRETVTIGDVHTVRLEYAGNDGESFSLFLRPRWESKNNQIRVVTEDDDVSLAVWLDGPLAVTLAGKLPPDRMNRIAETVRNIMHAGNDTMPQIKAPAGAERNANLSTQENAVAPGAQPAAERAIELPATNSTKQVIVN